MKFYTLRDAGYRRGSFVCRESPINKIIGFLMILTMAAVPLGMAVISFRNKIEGKLPGVFLIGIGLLLLLFVAREHYGYTLAQAKQFIDELTGKSCTTSTTNEHE